MLKAKIIAALLSTTMFSASVLPSAIRLKNNNKAATNSIVNYVNQSNMSMSAANNEIKSLLSQLKIYKTNINNLVEESQNISCDNYKLQSENEKLQKELDSLLGKTLNFKTSEIQYNIKTSKALYNNPVNCNYIISYIATKYLHVPSKYSCTLDDYIAKLFKNNHLSGSPTGNESANKILEQIVESKMLLNSDGSVNEIKCYNLINYILENDLGYERGGIGIFTYSVQEVDMAIRDLANGTYYGIDGIKRILDEIFAVTPEQISNKANKTSNIVVMKKSKEISSNILKTNTLNIKNNNINATNSIVNYLDQSDISMQNANIEIKSLCKTLKMDKDIIKSLNVEISSLNSQNQQLKAENQEIQNKLDSLIGEGNNLKSYRLLYNLRDSKAIYNNYQNCAIVIDFIVTKYLKISPEYLPTSLNLLILPLYPEIGSSPTGTQTISQLMQQIQESGILLNPNGSVNTKASYNLVNYILENDLGYPGGGGSRYDDDNVYRVDKVIKELVNGTYWSIGNIIHNIFEKNNVKQNNSVKINKGEQVNNFKKNNKTTNIASLKKVIKITKTSSVKKCNKTIKTVELKKS